MIRLFSRINEYLHEFFLTYRMTSTSRDMVSLRLCNFFQNEQVIKKIDFANTVKRICNNKKQDLLIDPLGMCDLIWCINEDSNSFKKLVFEKYMPSKQITLCMPKGNLMFRPVSYLLPIDSLIYQGLVDTIINYKHNKFSKQVYSNIINKITYSDVFHNPVEHWLVMKNNLRRLQREGYNLYFTSDISGYFENIKINPLMDLLDFYIGRNETVFKGYLTELLIQWQYADSQGLIQTHAASSILGKIYLAQLDSELAYLNRRYSRYVDEFHIMAHTKQDLIKIALKINNTLRDLGLNLNISKTKVFEGEEISIELDKDKDFFDGVNYFESIYATDTSLDIVRKKFKQLQVDFSNDSESINKKVFRYCIHKFQRERVADGVEFCFDVLRSHPDQTVDIVKYLKVFINDRNDIVTNIYLFLNDPNSNLYQWQQVWLLILLLELKDSNINRGLLWAIANGNDQDDLSRSIAYLNLTKFLEDNELMILKRHYSMCNSTILKRTLLFCLTKLPQTFTKEVFIHNNSDDISITITKEYLQKNQVNWNDFCVLP